MKPLQFFLRLIVPKTAVIAVCLTATQGTASESKWEIVLESGAVWQSRNVVRIVPETGTLVEFAPFNKGPFLHYRAEAFYHFNSRHRLRLLYAPFSIGVSSTPTEDVRFNSTNFLAGSELNINYKFDSYRLSYIYRLFEQSQHSFDLGFTLKVRNADIRFSQGSSSDNYSNVGVVPLLYLAHEWSWNETWGLYTSLDFAAAPQGRALDLECLVRREWRSGDSLGLGYRTLEGGADNEKVFSFSWFHYGILQYRRKF